VIIIANASLALYEDIESTKLYWGDTHLHTAYSFDAYTFGTNATPDLAYRYSKGYPVIHPVLGTRIQIETPLDFLIITDHAELLGSISGLLEGSRPDLSDSLAGKFVLELAGNRTKKELDSVYNQLNRIGSGIENDS